MTISIIIPVYNAHDTLEKSVDSLYLQGFDKKDFEVILVNDGSTDDSLPICNKLSSKYGNIVVVDKPNGGVSSARNAGIQKARGKYLTLMDNDDALVPGALRLLTDCLDATNADVATGKRIGIPSSEMDDATKRLSEENGHISGWQLLDVGEYINNYTDIRTYELFQVWRTDFIKKNDIHFPEQLRLAEDVLFTVQGLLNAKKVAYTKYNFYMYQSYDKSVIHNVKMVNIISLIDAIPLLIPYWDKAKECGCLDTLKEITYHQMALMVYFLTHIPENWARRKDVYHHYRATVPFVLLGRTLPQRAASLLMYLSPSLYINIRKKT